MTANPESTENIAHRLELIRLALELSQVAIAKRIGGGITPQKWNNYKQARDRIPIEVAIRLCVVSSATLDYIYRGLPGGLPTALAQKIQEIEKPAARRSRRA